MGHGYACKHFGGGVHELGFMLVYFQPAFYCNVYDAWSFTARRSRFWVTAAGAWIQLVITSLAAIVWWARGTGHASRRVAVAAMLVGGASALLTNANPLLPLDGYFAFTDWIEIPNLRLRARAHFAWWLRRTLLRLEMPEPPATRARASRVPDLRRTRLGVTSPGLFVFLAFLLVGWRHAARSARWESCSLWR